MKQYIDRLLQYIGLRPITSDNVEPLFEVDSNYPPMPTPVAVMYGKVCRVIDGDTIEVELNKHHHHKLRMTLRLLGVDAREVRGPERTLGLSDKHYVEAWLKYGEESAMGEPFVIQTVATDKYGRWLAWLWRTCDKACLNVDMILTDHGEPAPVGAKAFLSRDIIDTMRGMDVDHK